MAGFQSFNSGVAAPGSPSQQGFIGNSDKIALPRRPIPPPPQQRTQSQQSVARTPSNTSSLQNVSSRPSTDAKSQSDIFGKTSGWYHGSKFDIAELIAAAEQRNHSTVKSCLKAGLNVNYCRWVKGDKILGDGARSVADVVACRNDIITMRLLIEYKVDLSGTPASTFATSSLTRSRVDFLFKGDEKKKVEKDSWTTPLHLACKHGYAEMARIIIEEGRADPNARDCLSRSALHMNAMGSASLSVGRLLLEQGAAVNFEDHSGATPLSVAALHGKVELAKLFIDNGAHVNSVDAYNETAIFNASLHDHLSTVSALASRGGNVNVRNTVGASAFFKAASRFKPATMNCLIECGADVDTRDNNGCTALLRATMAKNIQLLALLLQLGADVDAKDGDGCTPLLVAMALKDQDIIRLLLQSGANLAETDNYYNTSLSQAAILGATSVARHVLSFPHHRTSTYLQQTNLVGETPLTLACKHNSSPIVKLLLKHGDDPHHVDINGYRAIDRAMYWASFACVCLLMDAGVGIDGKSLFALQQGRFDNPSLAENHDMITSFLRSHYPQLDLPNAVTSSPLRELFVRPITSTSVLRRVREKQGKPPLKDEKPVEGEISVDPFEACIPESPIQQIINHHTTTINAKGIGGLEVGAAGANIALSVGGALLGL